MSTSLIDNDPDFYKGVGKFSFPNGDRYSGGYYAHRSGVIWREGFGKYISKDGHIYKGEWRDDKLLESLPVQAKYADGTRYSGYFVKNKYEGPGTYVFDHNMILIGNFKANKPIGELTLIDGKGREWHGTTGAQDEVVLLPKHSYFTDIDDNAGKGRRRTEPEEPVKEMSVIADKSLMFKKLKDKKSAATLRHKSSKGLVSPMSENVLLEQQAKAKEELLLLELRTFAKTRKTASDLQFEESDWYKNYLNFKTLYNSIKHKIKNGEGLMEKEIKWYEKYLQFKKRYCQFMEERKNKFKDMPQEKMFELFNQEKFRESCPPISVIYATDDCASVCECPGEIGEEEYEKE